MARNAKDLARRWPRSCGCPGSWRWYQCLEPGWANLANTPLRRSKIFVHEGGIATPLIVHWPRGIAARGELRHNPGQPGGSPAHDSRTGRRHEAHDMGRPPDSARAAVSSPHLPATTRSRSDYLWWFHSGNRAIRVGDMKLVSEGQGGAWELYDLSRRPRRIQKPHGLELPERARELEQLWQSRLEEFRALEK